MNTLLAALCVVLFSMTVPATRLAAQAMPPEVVAILRLLGAGGVCLVVVLSLDRWVPPRRIWSRLAATSFGSVWGFSLLIALAMRKVPGSHGAIGLAALPALTAAYASLRDRSSPGLRFWIYCALGTAVSLSFFVVGAGGGLQAGDLILIAAIFASAFGYVEGGRLSREFGGRRVMSWAILIALPFAIAAAAVLLPRAVLPPFRSGAWLAVAYLALVSQSLGMFVWYRVLAKGPMERIAMIQLVQPFFTLIGSAVLLGEHPGASSWAAAVLVVGSVFGANREKASARTPARPPCAVRVIPLDPKGDAPSPHPAHASAVS